MLLLLGDGHGWDSVGYLYLSLHASNGLLAWLRESFELFFLFLKYFLKGRNSLFLFILERGERREKERERNFEV